MSSVLAIMAALGRCGGSLRFFTSGWHVIHATGVPWVTFAQAFACQQATPGGTVHLDGLCRILRATGVKTTVLPQHGTNCQFIKSQQQEQQGFHHTGPIIMYCLQAAYD